MLGRRRNPRWASGDVQSLGATEPLQALAQGHQGEEHEHLCVPVGCQHSPAFPSRTLEVSAGGGDNNADVVAWSRAPLRYHQLAAEIYRQGCMCSQNAPGQGSMGVRAPISSCTPGSGLPRMNSWLTKDERDAAAQPHARCCAHLGMI